MQPSGVGVKKIIVVFCQGMFVNNGIESPIQFFLDDKNVDDALKKMFTRF